MERFKAISTITDNLWTYDHLLNNEVIGSVREPHLIITEGGQEFIPASLVYRKKKNGRYSDLLKSTYEKHLYDPYRSIHSVPEKSMEDYTIWDEAGNIFIVAVPVDKSEKFRSRDMLKRVLSENSLYKDVIQQIVDYFPECEFGVLGSVALSLNTDDSDLDLFVYGGENYQKLTSNLRIKNIQKDLNLYTLENSNIEKYAKDYSASLNISYCEAKRIAENRSRYIYKHNNTKLKISFNACFDYEKYQNETILGSKFLKDIKTKCLIKDTINSSVFPRIYVVETNDNELKVISHRWMAQQLIGKGVIAIVKGNLREKNNTKFITLEDPTDVIVSVGIDD